MVVADTTFNSPGICFSHILFLISSEKIGKGFVKKMTVNPAFLRAEPSCSELLAKG